MAISTKKEADMITAVLPESNISDSDRVWKDAGSYIDWFRPWEKLCNSDQPESSRWYEGGLCNTCYNALDRHVQAGNGAKTAMIYESPITNSDPVSISYGAMLDRVKKIAGMLRGAGVEKGQRVVIYMPMIPEAVMAMLACARIGAVHSVVFGGFASEELAKRISHAKAEVVLLASCGIEPSRVINYKTILDDAITMISHRLRACFVFQRPQLEAELANDHDFHWQKYEDEATPVEEATPLLATDPLYILYTSGTTGAPKGVVRDNGGYMAALLWSMRNIYGLNANDVFWTASDVGWVVGHSYIVYAPLLLGCTSVLFEGKPVGTPNAGVFWRIIQQHQVSVLFTAPTALRAIIRDDSDGAFIKSHDLSTLRALFLAGERSDPATISWAQKKLNVPVVDHWWQTETGWTICGNLLSESGIPKWTLQQGAAGKPMPGYNLKVLDENGRPVEDNQLGALCIALPLPPGCFNTLWDAHDLYLSKYMTTYPGYYETGDSGCRDAEGYVYVMSRTDDIINVSGHRLSTGQMEEIVIEHPAVAECAVFGIDDSLKGQIPYCLFVVKSNTTVSHDVVAEEIKRRIIDRIGAIAKLAMAVCVDRLPKTRSGKILRATLSKCISNKPWTMPPTVDDPTIFDNIKHVVEKQAEPKR